MNPNGYQRLAARTECNQTVAAQKRLLEDSGLQKGGTELLATRLCHAAMGLAGEVGEFNYAVEKWLQYDQDLDVANIKEELGDILWYVALACNALDINLSDVMEGNIAKLVERYPDKYSDSSASEENRDRDAEIRAMTREEVVEDCINQTGIYRAEVTEEFPIPKGVYSELQLLDIKARNVAKRDHLCPKCKNLVNDEVIRKLYIDLHTPKTDDGMICGCPNCAHHFAYKDLICPE